GADKTATEHYNLEAPMERNPFPTDIYHLGNMIREHPLHVRPNFLRPLVKDMVKENPSDRPIIDKVVIPFDALRKSLSR
ncbi:hypothetical protein IW261DRAFT_1326275, partial [Armillaria novae-zelandiae]